MAEIAFILTGKPKRGTLPPLKRMDAKAPAAVEPSAKGSAAKDMTAKGLTAKGPASTDKPESTGGSSKKSVSTMIDESTIEKPAGKISQDEAGFWNESAPRICETCGYREEGGCRKVDGVDWEECDQTLSGCSKWEAGEAEEDDEEAEEDEE